MKPTICSRCKKNIAVIFITKVENGVSTNEGLCLKCARELKIKQVDDIVERMGITDEDLDNLNGEMMAMMQPEPDETDEDDIGSRTATFPHMNRLFGNQGEVAPREEPKETQNGKTEKPKVKKHKFLDTYCLSLTGRARAGELDKVVGREVETERVVQILPASSVSRASARRPSPRVWRSASSRAMSRSSCATKRSICST